MSEHEPANELQQDLFVDIASAASEPLSLDLDRQSHESHPAGGHPTDVDSESSSE